jgi:DNA polymerase-1
MSRLILIDGSAVAYRSYFALIRNPLINSRGENTGAVFGFVSSLNKIVRDYAPDYLAVVFDTPAPTFRHKIYDEYKSTRAKTPDELVEQFPWIDKAIDGFNIPVIRKDGYEADDLIGTLSVKAAEAGVEVLMFTGDKDFYQLVTDRINILHPKDFSVIDPDGVKERFGVPPQKVVDVLALMGDTVDNIPGIQGIGPKTAVSLIEEFGDFETTFQEGPKKRKGKIARMLAEQRNQAEMSYNLVSIKTDCPVDFDTDALARREPNNAELAKLFARLEFKSLMEKYAQRESESLFDAGPGKSSARYSSVTSVSELEGLLSEIEKRGELAIDTETTSLNALKARLVGISFSFAEETGHYIPVGHERGDNLPLDGVLEKLSRLFESGVKIIGQNLKYDRQIFKNHGVDMGAAYFDTMIAAYLINPGARGYNLDSMVLEKFKYKMIPIGDLIGKGKDQKSFAAVDINRATFYAVEDADFTLRLKNLLEPELKRLKLDRLFHEIEMPLMPVLGEMEEAGVRIDTAYLRELSTDYGDELSKIEAVIYEEAGEEFNLNSPRQLATVLFDKLNLKSTRRTAKGGSRSTSVDILEKLAEIHPVPRMVLDYRQLAKLKSTYIDALPDLIDPETSRVHTSFNQTVAATGRLSSSDPNLQNIPIRTEEGRRIRKAFIPADGDHRILSADYSQVELRIMAHFASDETMIESFKSGEDIHRRTAAEVYGVDIADVTQEQRRAAKTANFAIIYGVSAYGLSQQSELSLTESKDFIDIYFKRYPGIKKYMDDMIKFARKEGYVATLFDRRRYLPDINAKSAQARQFAERTAINTPIQGTAADMIKMAMINIFKSISGMKSRMILQVHDELVFDAHMDEIGDLKKIVIKEMENAVKLDVPIKVDIEAGENWLEAH